MLNLLNIPQKLLPSLLELLNVLLANDLTHHVSPFLQVLILLLYLLVSTLLVRQLHQFVELLVAVVLLVELLVEGFDVLEFGLLLLLLLLDLVFYLLGEFANFFQAVGVGVGLLFLFYFLLDFLALFLRVLYLF